MVWRGLNVKMVVTRIQINATNVNALMGLEDVIVRFQLNLFQVRLYTLCIMITYLGFNFSISLVTSTIGKPVEHFIWSAKRIVTGNILSMLNICNLTMNVWMLRNINSNCLGFFFAFSSSNDSVNITYYIDYRKYLIDY